MFAEELEVGSVVRHKEQGFIGVVKELNDKRATVVVTENGRNVDAKEYIAVRSRLEVITSQELSLKTIKEVVKAKKTKAGESTKLDSKLTDELFTTMVKGLLSTLSNEQTEQIKVTDADVIEVESNGSIIRFNSYENFERFIQQMK